MQTNEETGTIDITQKRLFEVFSSIEQRGKKPSEKDYYAAINNHLPPVCHLLPGECTQLNNQIRTYKRWKQNKRSPLQDLVKSSSNEVVVSINIPPSRVDVETDTDTTAEVLPDQDVLVVSPGSISAVVPQSSDELVIDQQAVPAAAEVPLPTHNPAPLPTPSSPPLDERPPLKKSRNSFTATFTKSWKDFNDLKERQKKNITKPLVDMLERFISTNEFTISITELLDYLKTRVKEAKTDIPSISFSSIEAVSFMHCMALSKEDMRQTRYFLKQKEIEFPTTNKLLPVRQSLRSPTFPVLDGKGRGLDIKELVVHTASSIIKIVKEDNPNRNRLLDCLKLHLKDGGDGAGSMPSLRSKKKPKANNDTDADDSCVGEEDDDSDEDEDEAEHMFQYGIIPLKLVRNIDGQEEIYWQNKVPNSARSLRPIYLIREKETEDNLLDFVIKETDRVRKDLNSNGLLVPICLNNEEVYHHVTCDMRDTMKDLKFRKAISGLDCILCKSKVAEWTNVEKIKAGGFRLSMRMEIFASDQRTSKQGAESPKNPSLILINTLINTASPSPTRT